jgi:2,5-diamino-6-(ribosylamino)-4(3H)-pyrimidinone 5'-phosphate reductase
MLPKVIVHNSVSLDGSLTNFKVNMPIHYRIAESFKGDIHLVGSNTAKTGIDMFLVKIPKETQADFKKPDKEGILWAIPDTTGKLKDLLHIFRQSEYCKDVVILVSQKAPKEYISYLKERNYDYHIIGEDKCNLKRALKLLNEKYNAKKILTDTGCILSNLLINQGLISEISLLVHPVIVGRRSYNMFGNIANNTQLALIKKEFLEEQFIWIKYKFEK